MRAAAATIAALMLLWLVVAVALLALGGCSPRVPAVEPSSSVKLPWCFRVLLRAGGKPHVLGACSMDRPSCEHWREMARDRGAMAGIEAVGSCR